MPSFNCLIEASEEIVNYCPKWDICQGRITSHDQVVPTSNSRVAKYLKH